MKETRNPLADAKLAVIQESKSLVAILCAIRVGDNQQKLIMVDLLKNRLQEAVHQTESSTVKVQGRLKKRKGNPPTPQEEKEIDGIKQLTKSAATIAKLTKALVNGRSWDAKLETAVLEHCRRWL